METIKMATKDWEKYAENEESPGMGWGIEWYRKDDKYSYAKAWHTGLPASEMKRRGLGSFFFSGRIGRDGKETKKDFKTKQQALAYAQSWMRTH